MPKFRAVIVGAGRIGAGFNWDQDLAYTHAGAYMALKDRVELIGFVEPDQERAEAACLKWKVPALKSIADFKDFDIVSICTRDEDHMNTFVEVFAVTGSKLKGVWMEKPFPWSVLPSSSQPLIQVNYQRRADPVHREIACEATIHNKRLIVYGKDNETTRCHFRDLARFWDVPLDYRVHDGPCAYVLERRGTDYWFDNGGVNSGECFRLMLENLLDAVESKAELWSPPY